MRSMTKPITSSPRSEYSYSEPGARTRLVASTAFRADSGPAPRVETSRPAGNPDRCVSRSRIVTCSFAPPVNARQVVRHTLVEPQLSLIDEDHRGRGRGGDFGERCEVIHGSLGVDRDSRSPVQRAIATLPDNAAVPGDNHRGPGETTSSNAAVHNVVDHRESRHRHPHGLGRHARQARGHIGRHALLPATAAASRSTAAEPAKNAARVRKWSGRSIKRQTTHTERWLRGVDVHHCQRHTIASLARFMTSEGRQTTVWRPGRERS